MVEVSRSDAPNFFLVMHVWISSKIFRIKGSHWLVWNINNDIDSDVKEELFNGFFSFSSLSDDLMYYKKGLI